MQIVMMYCSPTVETKGEIRQAGLARPGQLEIAEWKKPETGGDSSWINAGLDAIWEDDDDESL